LRRLPVSGRSVSPAAAPPKAPLPPHSDALAPRPRQHPPTSADAKATENRQSRQHPPPNPTFRGTFDNIRAESAQRPAAIRQHPR